MIDISKLHPHMCSIFTKRSIFVSDAAWDKITSAMVAGHKYLTTPKSTNAGYQKRRALYYVLKRLYQEPMQTDDFASYHRVLLKYGGLYHIIILKLYKNPQQLIVMLAVDAEDSVLEDEIMEDGGEAC